MLINTYLSIITLNVNGLNVPIKRHRGTEWIKNKIHVYAAYKTHFRPKDTCRLKVKEWKNSHANGNERKLG